MLILKKILLFLVSSLCLSFVFADDDCFDQNLISIRENFFSDDIIGYYLTSIDIESGESNVLLFAEVG